MENNAVPYLKKEYYILPQCRTLFIPYCFTKSSNFCHSQSYPEIHQKLGVRMDGDGILISTKPNDYGYTTNPNKMTISTNYMEIYHNRKDGGEVKPFHPIPDEYGRFLLPVSLCDKMDVRAGELVGVYLLDADTIRVCRIGALRFRNHNY